MAVVELAHEEAGNGTPVVLLHAFPLGAGMWREARGLLAAGCRVITPEQRGFGASALGQDPPSLEHCADDVVALLDRLGLERIVLGGLSMGGYVAMELLRRAPERVAALVLADTKASADAPEARETRRKTAETVEREGTAALAEQMLPALLGATSLAERPAVVERVRGLIAAAPPAAVAWASRAMAARPDSGETLRGVRVPALVVVGDEDALSPVAAAQEMTDALPLGRLAVVPEAGHLTAIEDPKAFAEVVAGFLAGLPDQARA